MNFGLTSTFERVCVMIEYLTNSGVHMFVFARVYAQEKALVLNRYCDRVLILAIDF